MVSSMNSWNVTYKTSIPNYKHTLAISSGVRAPLMSCLFASISRDAPDSLYIWKYWVLQSKHSIWNTIAYERERGFNPASQIGTSSKYFG